MFQTRCISLPSSMEKIFHKTYTNNSQIYVWKVVSTYDSLFKKTSWSTKEMQSLLDIKSEKRKIEFMATRIAVKSIFGIETILKHLDSGQPYIQGNKHISISHSKNYIVIAVGDRCLGVDIEEPSEKLLKVLPRILSKSEYEDFQKNPSITLACKVWGTKESILKYTGNVKLDYRKDIRLEKIKPLKASYIDTVFNVEFENIENLIVTLVTD